MTLPNYPSEVVLQFGVRVSDALFDADIRKTMEGLGGCKPHRLEDFDEDLRPYIEAYIVGNNTHSIALTYAAMRTKEIENDH